MMNPVQSYFFFFASLIVYTLASPTLQKDILLEFKNEFMFISLDPDPDDDFSLWNTSISDYCSWRGVKCDAKSGEVISLVLDFILLNRPLKSNSSLFKLQHLSHLSLSACDLRGEIISSLGNLPHLTYLDLSNNHLVGEIPSSLGNLSHLTYLDLSNNHLIGEVPSSIGSLNQLTFLSFSSNNLSGNIPISFANFNKLSNLLLYQNKFSYIDFPRILPNLTSLFQLDLGYNHFKSNFKSTFLTDMNGLHKLEKIDVTGNSFFGNFPTFLFTIPSLKIIYLEGNQFEGAIEFENTSSSSILSINLAHNNFCGPIPESISGFLNLQDLYLSHNIFSGPIPRSMSKLVSLSDLDLSYNKLEGQVPSFLWRLYSLKLSHNSFTNLEKSDQVVFDESHIATHFDLSSNLLEEVVPRLICKSRSIGYLDMSNNHLTGSIPSCLKNSVASFGYLNLRNNNISGSLPDIFVNATQLVSLDVSHNQLVGKLPKSLINCSTLEFLNLKGNKIKDMFPSWLKSLGSLQVLLLGSNAFYGPIYHPSSHLGFPSLRVIDISHNNFNGTLPQDYFVNWFEMLVDETEWTETSVEMIYMRNEIYGYEDSMNMIYKGVETEFPRILLAYKAIDFSGNKFKGRIPKSIGLLKGLRLLNLSGNAFTGNIPSALANIANLEALDLSRNKLSGQIPRDLGNLSFLSYLDFSHNLLEGTVPRGTQFQTQNCASYQDNLRLIGLEEICGKSYVQEATAQQPQEFSSEPEEVLINWIAAAIAYAPGVFCGLVIGHIFMSHKHKWFIKRFRRNNPRCTRSAH